MRVIHQAFTCYGRGVAIGIMACATFAVAGCASRGGVVPYDPAGFGPPDLEKIQVAPTAQVIGPLDEISIAVFQVPDLTGKFTVDADGTILYPLLGSIGAAGRTPSALADDIAERLGRGYLQRPDVQVAITQAAEQTITIEGAVREPGVVPIRGGTTLVQAIALGRGTSETANPSRVVVFRTIDGQRMAAAFDLKAIRRAKAPDPAIYGNDIIVVDGSRSRSLFKDAISVLPVIGIFRPF
jgi:polysaccharide biosynthesis/export protein